MIPSWRLFPMVSCKPNTSQRSYLQISSLWGTGLKHTIFFFFWGDRVGKFSSYQILTLYFLCVLQILFSQGAVFFYIEDIFHHTRILHFYLSRINLLWILCFISCSERLFVLKDLLIYLLLSFSAIKVLFLTLDFVVFMKLFFCVLCKMGI